MAPACGVRKLRRPRGATRVQPDPPLAVSESSADQWNDTLPTDWPGGKLTLCGVRKFRRPVERLTLCGVRKFRRPVERPLVCSAIFRLRRRPLEPVLESSADLGDDTGTARSTLGGVRQLRRPVERRAAHRLDSPFVVS